MKKTTYVIKWTNIHSGEEGFVKAIKAKENHFENTFEVAKAKSYAALRNAEKAIAGLVEMGEGINNNFTIIEN